MRENTRLFPLNILFVFVALIAMAAACAFAGPPSGGHFGGGNVAAHFAEPSSHFASPRGPIPGPGIAPQPFAPAGTGYWTASGYHGPARIGGYSGGHYGAYNGRRFDYRRFPVGYFLAPYYYPFLDYDSSPYLDNGPPPPDQGGPDMYAMQNELGQQVQALGEEVQQLKYAQRGPYPPNPYEGPPPPPAPQTAPLPPSPPLTLVLRDGQRVNVRNYAVTDATFWDFTNDSTRKIPLSNIDLDASAKATQANGGEFPVLTPPPDGGN